MDSTSTEAETVSRAEVEALRPAPLTVTALDRVPGVLGRIAKERAVDASEAEAAGVPFGGVAPAVGGFRRALAGPTFSVIAEVKRGSPSQGRIRDLDPVETARAYRRGGASAVSVLTEPRHFGGSLEHLREVARHVPVPALRKDFIVHPVQIEEAAAAGAHAVLAIVAVLRDALAPYVAYARAWGLDVLVEVHDDAELDVALAAGVDLLGVNNRDLTTLEIDLRTAPALLEQAREAGFTGVAVAESGYDDAASLSDVVGLADAALIGTSLARQGDPGSALERLLRDVRVLERASTKDG